MDHRLRCFTVSGHTKVIVYATAKRLVRRQAGHPLDREDPGLYSENLVCLSEDNPPIDTGAEACEPECAVQQRCFLDRGSS